jgi:WD40 repeat protein
MPDESDQRDADALAAVLADYLLLVDRGEPVGRDAFIAQHPEHSAALRDYFNNVDLIENALGTPRPVPVRDRERCLALDPATPRPFGNYELVAEIGRGGMGIVYAARERATGRAIALKMLLHSLFLSPAEIRRFRNEASLAAGLEHRGIVPIYHVDEHDGHLFYTMPLVKGTNLAQRLAGGPFEPHTAAKLLLTIAEAVAFAHANGIVHRDLKPANILLDEQGEPHVADFGLARRLGDEAHGITATGDLLGTPNYMAPEQVNSQHALVGPATDVYALGAVLYALLAGQAPFHSASVSETLHKICTTEPTRPRQLNRNVPRDLETICLKCLEKSPQNRYPSARELADDLQRFLAGKPLLAQRVSGIERTRRWFARNPVVGSLAVGILLALIAGTGFSTYYALQSRMREKEALANLYAADMNLAQQHIRAGAVASAIRLLKKHSTLNPEPATMPWEWRHMWHQCHGELRRFEGPQGAVYSASFSPDGRTVAAAGADKTLWLWETATGKVLHQLKGHTATIRDLAFAPDGKRLVTVGDDCIGIVWDTIIGKRLNTFSSPNLDSPRYSSDGHPGPKRPLTTVAWSVNGRFIAFGGNEDGHVSICDAITFKLLQSLDLGPAESLAFSPDNARLAIAGGDGFVRICTQDERNAWTVESAIAAHRHIVRDVAWSADGTRLATASADQVVKVWDTNSWSELFKIGPLKEQVYSVSFSIDDRDLAIAVRYEPLMIWDVDRQETKNNLLGHTALVTSIDFSADGWRLVSASEDGTVRLWDPARRGGHDRLEGHHGKVRSVALSPKGDWLASSGAADSSIILWNVLTSAPVRVIRPPMWGVNDLAFSPNGNELALALGDSTQSSGRLVIWDVAANRTSLSLPTDRAVSGVAWARNGNRLALHSLDGTVRLVNAIDGRELARQSSPSIPGSIQFSPNGELLITGHIDHRVRVWRAETLSPFAELVGHSAPVVHAAFNPQGSLIASSSNDHTIRIWDTETGKHLRTLSGHEGTPLAIAFSPDGERLVSCSVDQTVKIWEVATGLELQSLVGHTHWVRDIASSADGQNLASAGYDGVIRVWHAPTEFADLATTREAAALVKHLAARYSAREPLLAAIHADKSVTQAVRALAIGQAKVHPFYWSFMLAGHGSAESGDWKGAIDAFQRVIELAPDDVLNWYWLAIANLAGENRDAYRWACDEMLRRYSADSSANEVSHIVKTSLLSPRHPREVVQLAPAVESFTRRFPEGRYVYWLYQLRSGTLPPELIGPKPPPVYRHAQIEDNLVRAMAWHKAGDITKARSAYESAIRARRGAPIVRWEAGILYSSLRREVEGLLGIDSAAEGDNLSSPVDSLSSTPGKSAANGQRKPISSAVER